MTNAIIIDDEKNSRDILEWQISKYCPKVKVVASIGSASEALEMVSKLKPQLVFLDIQMPELNGFELLEKLNPVDFEVIFTTAFTEYAVKAFKFDALDYLLKPIDITELKIAVSKVEDKIDSTEDRTPVGASPTLSNNKRLALTTTNSLVFVDLENIIYCEGKSNYTYFHLSSPEKKILVSRTLKDIEDILAQYNFFRIHNSYLINMKYIKEYIRGAGGYVVMTNGEHITVARSRKEDFFDSFKKF